MNQGPSSSTNRAAGPICKIALTVCPYPTAYLEPQRAKGATETVGATTSAAAPQAMETAGASTSAAPPQEMDVAAYVEEGAVQRQQKRRHRAGKQYQAKKARDAKKKAETEAKV